MSHRFVIQRIEELRTALEGMTVACSHKTNHLIQTLVGSAERETTVTVI